ncbi:hypothetical protein NDU88_002733 [Pleurodeles waltl]|uniref:Uncharacterized protein n=1 Tax=Pleurodeles waltl TaxID=8319 RepID=A0AAV7M2I9_PLEWA|nr:hypothetical protein NDU88_002733 [Pleurodeles waltl]
MQVELGRHGGVPWALLRDAGGLGGHGSASQAAISRSLSVGWKGAAAPRRPPAEDSHRTSKRQGGSPMGGSGQATVDELWHELDVRRTCCARCWGGAAQIWSCVGVQALPHKSRPTLVANCRVAMRAEKRTQTR